jgi:hypothetical protein
MKERGSRIVTRGGYAATAVAAFSMQKVHDDDARGAFLIGYEGVAGFCPSRIQ